jgi:hypothetical protein
MKFEVYKKVEEQLRSILKITSADITEVSGAIKKNKWSGDELAEIEQYVEERLPALRALESRFANEVKLNKDEDGENVSEYFFRLDEELNAFRYSFLQLLEILEQGQTSHKNKAIQSIKNVVVSIEILLDLLIFYEPFNSQELMEEFALKLLYLQFSGIIDAIKKSLKEKFGSGRVTNVRLAETLSLITDENLVIIEKLLSIIPDLTAGNPHPVFTGEIIAKAITYLERDGFSVSSLETVLEKMHKVNK